MDFADRVSGLFGPRQRQVSFAKLLDFAPLSPAVQAHLAQVTPALCEPRAVWRLDAGSRCCRLPLGRR